MDAARDSSTLVPCPSCHFAVRGDRLAHVVFGASNGYVRRGLGVTVILGVTSVNLRGQFVTC